MSVRYFLQKHNRLHFRSHTVTSCETMCIFFLHQVHRFYQFFAGNRRWKTRKKTLVLNSFNRIPLQTEFPIEPYLSVEILFITFRRTWKILILGLRLNRSARVPSVATPCISCGTPIMRQKKFVGFLNDAVLFWTQMKSKLSLQTRIRMITMNLTLRKAVVQNELRDGYLETYPFLVLSGVLPAEY